MKIACTQKWQVGFILFVTSNITTPMDLSFLLPQRSAEVKHISLADKTDLDANGYMSVAFLIRLLKQAYQEKKLVFNAFRKPEDFRIKKLTEAEKEAQWGSTQLFLIETLEQSFIIKGIKKSEEIGNLIQSVNIPVLSSFLFPNSNYKYPQFVFPIAYLSYTDQKGKKQYFSLMPSAPGVSLSDLLKKFVANPRNQDVMRAVSQAYFDVGAAMARFYLATGRKIAHGDLHHGNIFYDAARRRVTLIDNDHIAQCFENANMCDESSSLLITSLFIVKRTNPGLLKKLKLQEWYDLFLPSYIAGYLSTFPQQERKKTYFWLVSCIKKSKNRRYVVEILGFSHKKYMDRIFEKLKSSDVLFQMDETTVNLPDKNGKTLLHKVALQGEWRLVWPLIMAGANIEARDNDLYTLLHEASYYNHAEVIKALVKAGANLNVQDIHGLTPLDKAELTDSKDAIKVLTYYGAVTSKHLRKENELIDSLQRLVNALKNVKKIF